MVSSSAGNGPCSVSPVGSNSGIHTSSSCSNATCTFMPTNTSSGAHVHHVRGEADPVVLLDGDDRDHVRRREAGEPRVLVDREPATTGAARHLGRRPLGGVAMRADRRGRETQLAALGAALEPQHTVAAGGPEELVLGRELGQRALVVRAVGVGHPATLNAAEPACVRGAREGRSSLPRMARFDSCYTHGFARVVAAIPRLRLADPRYNAAQTVELAERAAVAARGAGGVPRAGPGRLQQPGSLPPAAADRSRAGRVGSRAHVDVGTVAGAGRGASAAGSSPILQRRRGVAPREGPRRRPEELPAELPRVLREASLQRRAPSDRRHASRCSTTTSRSGPTSCSPPTDLDDFVVAVEICEDLWVPIPPSTYAAMAGATVVANPSGSNITSARRAIARSCARRSRPAPSPPTSTPARARTSRPPISPGTGTGSIARTATSSPRRERFSGEGVAGRRPTSTSTGSSPTACG